MSCDLSPQAEELLAIVQDETGVVLDAVDRQAVVAYLRALQAGQNRPAAFDAANAVLIQAGRPPLNWEEYARQRST